MKIRLVIYADQSIHHFGVGPPGYRVGQIVLVEDGTTESNWSVNIDMKNLIKFITLVLLFFSAPVYSASIDLYKPGIRGNKPFSNGLRTISFF